MPALPGVVHRPTALANEVAGFLFISFCLLFLRTRISLQQVRRNIRQVLTLAMISTRIPGWPLMAQDGKCPDSPNAAKSNLTNGLESSTGPGIRGAETDQTTTPNSSPKPEMVPSNGLRPAIITGASPSWVTT